MKVPFLLHSPALFLAVVMWLPQFATAQSDSSGKKKNDNPIAALIKQQDYCFQAESATSMGGKTRYLTGDYYSLNVSKDSVVSFLPYYGRAYTAPISSSENGIEFTSTKFLYTVETTKKGGWEITIIPSDAQGVQQMYLSVSASGYASLQVNSMNRQSISFRGEISPRRHKR